MSLDRLIKMLPEIGQMKIKRGGGMWKKLIQRLKEIEEKEK